MNETNPNPDDQLDALFALARARRPDTAKAEYAFETRLQARLRAARSTDSIWARVSWRMIPFFGACLVALALWRAEIVTEVDDAQQAAYLENSDTLEQWTTLN